MPTGVALRDPRGQLFAAAERVLLRDGAHGLTSRAVTAEAGCAKGVLHRHFEDFDAFLAELVLDRVTLVEQQAATLRSAAGSGSVIEHLTEALASVFSTVVTSVVGLLIARDDLRSRLRRPGASGLPLLRETTAMVADYLTAEQKLGRIAGAADVPTLAPTLVGAAHLRFADREAGPPRREDVQRFVTAVLGSVVRD